MLEEGLFERFPMDAVYGMHNRPGLPVGRMQMRDGPSMAGFDIFEITVEGYGSHAARPHQGIDPVVIQAQIVMALQTIASRQVDPIESVVLSVTQVHGGDTRSEEHTSELQALMRISSAVCCLKKKKTHKHKIIM